MNNFPKPWKELKSQERVLLVGGVLCILGLVGWLMWWSLKSDYKVLFSELEMRDAAAVVNELKRMKVPYKVVDGGIKMAGEEKVSGGVKILVDAKSVHETRLALMNRSVPLAGGIGFEIFDGKDVGMTEYTQKINYQRALQGELARTIMAIEQVKQARVHLVVEESGLFKRQKAQPKASVSLVMKPDAQLSAEQIAGIQRLVAAAVPGLDLSRVTVSDQRGVTLSSTIEGNEEVAAANNQLRLKKQIEEYFTRKVVDVMDRTFGPGQAIVSVDATLNFDEIRRTQESLTPYRGSDGMTGVIVRKRQSLQPQARGTTVRTSEEAEYGLRPQAPVASTTEVEYEIGKTIEQVVSQPGGLKRVTVGVVIPKPLDNEQLARLREVVGTVIGFSNDRGDAITIQPMDRLAGLGEEPAAATVKTAPTVEPTRKAEAAPVPKTAEGAWLESPTTWAGLALAALLMIVIVALVSLRRRPAPRAPEDQPSAQDREQLLKEIKHWLENDNAREAA